MTSALDNGTLCENQVLECYGDLAETGPVVTGPQVTPPAVTIVRPVRPTKGGHRAQRQVAWPPMPSTPAVPGGRLCSHHDHAGGWVLRPAEQGGKEQVWFTERWKWHTGVTKTACCSTGVPTRGPEGRSGEETAFHWQTGGGTSDPPGERALPGRVILGSVHLKQAQIHGP